MRNHKLKQIYLWQVGVCTFEEGVKGLLTGELRPLLAPRVYTLPLVRALGKTMVQGRNYGPQITVKRIATRYNIRGLVT